MSKTVKILLPIAVVVASASVAGVMVWNKPKPASRMVEAPVPVVRVIPAQPEDRRLTVRSQGTVNPRTESVLVPEVAGRVVWVSPAFAPGGFFEAHQTLLRIEAIDYRRAVVQSKAEVARAELRLASEQAEADLARREWGELGSGEATALTLREPQVAEARAALEAARASVEQADRNLARTEIRAPYVGRVRQKQVDVGGYVSPGMPVATIYAVDFAEIRLPVPDADLAFLDLPLAYRGAPRVDQRPHVVLRADFAGKTHEWNGEIVRTEGEIDPRTRLVHVVARVKDPYGRGDSPGRPPLAAGLFVEAEIFGRNVEGVFAVPRSAVRDGKLLIVDDESRLRFRAVEILRTTEGEAIVSGGLARGERVCISPLAAVTEGMRVRVAGAQDAT